MSRALVLISAALLVCAAVVVAVLGEDEPPRQASPDAPNFIVVMTDDQALNTWNRDVMPRTFERIVDEGTDFREAFALPPLCCPARASFMTGRYPHNHGVLVNNYEKLEDPQDVLPVWLDEAGYQTMLAGKFLNQYEDFQGTRNGLEPAPGWDEWWSAKNDLSRYFDYTASVDGEAVRYGSKREDYVTNALTDAAADFIGERSPGDPPFFLWMTHVAPHIGHIGPPDAEGPCPAGSTPTPLPSDLKAARDVRLPKPPNYLEPNINDKPPFVARLPEGSNSNERLRRRHQCSVAALAAVDRSVERVFKTLEATGEADNTVVFFISDNGTFLGEHRKREGKKIPYDPALRVPLAVVAPSGILGDAGAPTADTPVGTIDLAPTILELAGLEGEHRLDGRSLLGAMRGEKDALPPDRGLAVELGTEDHCGGYLAYRDRAFLYTQYRRPTPGGACGVGVRELYDVRDDPFQLRNLLGTSRVAPADKAQADALSKRLEELSTCSGIEGRDPPGGAPFCE